MIYTEDSQLRLENVNALDFSFVRFLLSTSVETAAKTTTTPTTTGPTLVVWFSEKHLDLLTTSTAIITSRVFMATAEGKKRATLCFVCLLKANKRGNSFTF